LVQTSQPNASTEPASAANNSDDGATHAPPPHNARTFVVRALPPGRRRRLRGGDPARLLILCRSRLQASARRNCQSSGNGG
jgi:hypothetical protein